MDRVISISKEEEKALASLLWHSKSVCSSGCVYPEMQDREDLDCSSCIYTKSIFSIERKLGL